MTIGKGDLNTLFVPNSPQQGVMDALIDPKAIKNNWRRGIENFEHEVNRSIDASIKDKNTFLDIAYYNSTNSNGSLADNLNAIEISEEGVAEAKETEMFGMFIGAIEGINGKDKLDVTGDGKFNEEDYATQENYAALVKKALSGENLQLGKNLLKMHFNNQVLRHFNKEVEINTPTQEETTRPGRATTDTTTQKTTLETFSHTTGPEGVKEWTAPAAKQAAFNFFSKKQKPGDVYDGTHAYYAQIGKDKWNAYSSINDYNEHKKTGNPELKKGTYTQAQIIGFESGMNIESSNVDNNKI
jgi:hypothetical protein